MESFYGGRQGASFVIKGAFKFITDATRVVGDETKFVDEYYGQAWDELQLLKKYEGWKEGEGANQDPSSYSRYNELPKDPQKKAPYSSEDWEKLLREETMSVYFNDYENKDIWYGEYCIIDPTNKNNRNNGKIYRRTLKGAGDEEITGGVAEYIGQIVGPAGATPQLKNLNNVDAVEESFQNLSLGFDDEVRFYNQNGLWDESKNDGDSLKIHDFGHQIKMLPGNTTRLTNDHEEYFKDANSSGDGNTYIQNGGFNWYDVRINNSTEDISEIYIGFDIPYYVTEMEAGDVLPDIGEIEAIRRINRLSNPYGNAPYYEKYRINIPRGARGGWFEDIKAVKRENGIYYYMPSCIQYNLPTYIPLTDTISEDGRSQKDYSGYPESHYSEDGFVFNSETEVSKEIWPVGAIGWVGTFYWRSTKKIITPFQEVNIQNGVEVNTNTASYLHKMENIFLGLDRHIKNISFSDTGTLTFEYDAWTEKASVNPPNDDTTNNTNGIRVNGQNLDYLPQFETWIKKVDWIKKIEVSGAPSLSHISDAGTDAALESDYYNNSNANHRVPQGDVLKLTFNNETVNGANTDNNTAYEKNLRLISGIKTFKDGSLRVYRSDGTTNDFEKRITWIDGISTDANNYIGQVPNRANDTLTVHFNNTTLGGNVISKNLRLITGLNLTEDGIFEITRSDNTAHTSTGMHVTNGITKSITDNNITDLGAQLSWVKQVYRTSKNSPIAVYYGTTDVVDVHHLLIRFNNLIPGISMGLRQVSINGQSDWFDLGVVQETINGLFFDDKELKIEWREGQKAPDPYNFESSNALNWADYQLSAGESYSNYHNGLDGKAVIATIIKRKSNGTPYNPEKTEKVIMYYVSGEAGEYTGWKMLKSYEEQCIIIGSSTSEIPPGIIVIEDNASIPMNSLSTPWRV